MEPDLSYRLIGALGGTIIALALIEPRSWRGLAQRAIVSMVSGTLCMEPFAEYILRWPSPILSPSRIIAASCITAAASWWIAHGAIRLIQARLNR